MSGDSSDTDEDMDHSRSDAALVAAYLRGDRGALGEIYDRYAAALVDLATGMLRDPHDAADVLQDVFVIAAQSLDRLREPDRLRPWLFAIARHEVFRRTRSRSRSRPTDFTDPAATAGFRPAAMSAPQTRTNRPAESSPSNWPASSEPPLPAWIHATNSSWNWSLVKGWKAATSPMLSASPNPSVTSLCIGCASGSSAAWAL